MNLYECIADTIRNINLGPISISVPDLNVNRRELEEEEDDEDEKYFGITVGLGASVDVELANFVSATAAGVGIEFGYDDGKRGSQRCIPSISCAICLKLTQFVIHPLSCPSHANLVESVHV